MVVIDVVARLPQSAPLDIVYKRNTASNVEWNKANRTLALMCNKFRIEATLSLGCPIVDRQAVIDSMVCDITRGIHKCYANSIGTIKMRPNSSPVWSKALTLAVRRRHALAKASHRACRSGQVVLGELVEQHRAVKEALKSGLVRFPFSRVSYFASTKHNSAVSQRMSPHAVHMCVPSILSRGGAGGEQLASSQ